MHSIKGQMANILGFQAKWSVTFIQLCCCAPKTVTDSLNIHTGYAPVKLYLCILKLEFCIVFTCYKNIYLKCKLC